MKHRLAAFIVGFASVSIVAAPAFAIPAPDIIVGSLSGLTQVLTLLSVMIGGSALAGPRLTAGPTASWGQRSSRLFRTMVGAAVVLLAASALLNIYQWRQSVAERTERLQANLLRPAREPMRPVPDPSVKELTYGQQQKHPLGISTMEVARLLEEAKAGLHPDLLFLDVREAAETDMGGIPGFTIIRWPDFFTAQGQALLENKKQAIVICHNGNRSHETAEKLTAQGIPSTFMVGGVEKWIVEGRPMTGLMSRTPEKLRAITPYRNDMTILDTRAVVRLVKEQQAMFVDIRYPSEFESGHLPGAINLPLRILTTSELEKQIKALPHRPIVAPCYYRRSCFFAEVLGAEVSRFGYDFRGRYTVPGEWFEGATTPPHVVQWRARAQRSIWDKAIIGLSEAIQALTERSGTILVGILLLALLSRLLVLPFTLKSERDQIVARRFADEIEALKAKLRHDPRRLTRAIRAFNRCHGITPLRNLAALAFLPLFVVSLTAIDLVADRNPEALLWIVNLSAPDPLFILPGAFAALISFYLWTSLPGRGRLQYWMPALGGVVLVALMSRMSAAANLYAVVSGVLVVLQASLVAASLVRRWPPLAVDRDRAQSLGIVPLASAAQIAGTGSKAARLARLIEAGFPVPPGFVLTARVFAQAATLAGPVAHSDVIEKLTPAQKKMVDRLWRRCGIVRAAVRSSAATEDGQERSFAGVFETVLDVGRSDLPTALAKVAKSFGSERASSYAGTIEQGGIIVQAMVAAEWAGVLFTQHPSDGAAAAVEMVRGAGDALVSATATPVEIRYGRATGRRIGDATPPIDVVPLLALGRKAEQVFGSPQDIEWAYADGRFFVLQSRDITTLSPARNGALISVIERERARLLGLVAGAAPGEISLAQTELSELVPTPTPMTLSFLEAMWRPGGSVDLACRRLGLGYSVDEDSPPYLVSAFGRLYVNKLEDRRRTNAIGPLAAARLARAADRIAQHFRGEFLPDFLARIPMLEALDLDRLTNSELFRLFDEVRHRFITETYVEPETINIAAGFYVSYACRELERRQLSPANYLSHIPETVAGRAMAAIANAPEPAQRASIALESLGHRAELDYEISRPRYREDSVLLAGLVSTAISTAQLRSSGSVAEIDIRNWRDKPLARVVQRAREFQAVKEDAKHHCLRELAVLRGVLAAIDRRMGLDGSIYYLTLDEVPGLAALTSRRSLVVVAASRRAAQAAFDKVADLPAELSAVQLETLQIGAAPVRGAAAHGALRGTLVAGSAPLFGRARVISSREVEDRAGFDALEKGEIIVSRVIHPRWVPYFPRASALVCEVGGWLSHTAILAREYDVPMIVGVRGLDAIRTGDLLRLMPDGSIERVNEAMPAKLSAPAV